MGSYKKVSREMIKIVLVLGFMIILSSCSNAVLFNPKGTIAIAEKILLLKVAFVMLLVLIPVYFMTFYFIYKYRASNKNAEAHYNPKFYHSTLIELVCWGIPLIAIGYFAYLTWTSSHELDPFRSVKQNGEKELVVEVVALDWRWLFIYPEQGIASMNEVALPKNVPVKFMITSDAPMNSFWIPALGGQIYAMSGMHSMLHLRALEVGNYMGSSANFSGEWYSNMMFTAKVMGESDFNNWIASAKTSTRTLTMNDYKTIAMKSKDTSVYKYSLVTPDLFNAIINKYRDTSLLESIRRKDGKDSMNNMGNTNSSYQEQMQMAH